MSDRAIVLDANILIRAVMGKRVRELVDETAELCSDKLWLFGMCKFM